MPSETIFVFLKVFICVLFPHFLLVIPVSLKSFIDIYFLFIELCRKKERKKGRNKKERKKRRKYIMCRILFTFQERLIDNREFLNVQKPQVNKKRSQ